jgi:hypothetical protein
MRLIRPATDHEPKTGTTEGLDKVLTTAVLVTGFVIGLILWIAADGLVSAAGLLLAGLAFILAILTFAWWSREQDTLPYE